MDNKKNKTLTLVAIITLLLMVVGATYAFFAPQNGGTTSTNATVTSNTTDLLTFSINRDISFAVTQALFAENGENQSGDATATATLTPNNKTGAATMNYYLYLNLQNNPTVYSESNTNNDPELMLQVFDGNNQLVTLTGLGTQKTIKGVTGYDITGVSGLKTLLDNHAISASNNTAAIENWRIVITLINLDVNQNDNTGKTIEAEIIIRQDELSLGFTGTIYRNNGSITSNDTTSLNETWSYETDVNTIRSNYKHYIKHEVENKIIKKTEACIWYNNHEFCLGPNYWVGDAQDQIDGTTTKAKLQTAMETALGTQADSCSSYSGSAECSFGDLTCGTIPSGDSSCGNSYGYCQLVYNSEAWCEWA